jgi:hypothetical protein
MARTTDPYIGGSDRIDGGPGNDILIGGFGYDILFGDLSEDVMIGDNAAVIFTMDGEVLLVDTFGQDPLDRFVLFNLYGRDLDDDAAAPGNILFNTLGMAEAYVMMDLWMGNDHRFMHHHDAADQSAAPAQQAPASQAPAAGGAQGAGESQAPAPAAGQDLAPSGPQASEDDHGGQAASIQANVTDTELQAKASNLAGSAVILSLAGWRRKKAVLAEQRAARRAESKYRILVDDTRFAVDRRHDAVNPTSSKACSRMVYDTYSGKLKQQKVV